MNKGGFAHELACRTNLTVSKSEEIIAAILTILTERLVKREKVQFTGFGAFETKATSERTVRNFRTKETVILPAGYKPVFKASKVLREKINNGN